MNQQNEIKVLQFNTDRVRAAHDIAFAKAQNEGIDLILLQEPNRNLTANPSWMRDDHCVVAAYCLNKNVGLLSHQRGKGFLKLYFQDWVLYNCYVSPNITLLAFRDYIDDVMQSIRNERRQVIVAGDLNAKSPRWGSVRRDARGEYLVEWINTLNLVVINRGSTPTFARGNSSSFIDITLASDCMSKKVSKWKVSMEESMSLHRFITFSVDVKYKKSPFELRGKQTIERDLFKVVLGLLYTKMEGNYKTMIDKILQAQRTNTKEAVTTKMSQPYWWNYEIGNRHRICNRIRRKIWREKIKPQPSQHALNSLYTQHKQCKKDLRKDIRLSKRIHWKNVCEELDRDVWGQGYQIVTKPIKGSSMPYNLDENKKLDIVLDLFPAKDDSFTSTPTVPMENLFTLEELELAAGKLKIGKATGPDGVTPEALKLAIQSFPQHILNVMNDILKKQTFPKEWKKAHVVLLPKGSIEEENPKFRTICLLDCAGKLLEYMIKARLEQELEEKGGLSETQFGFRKGKSTVDAALQMANSTSDNRTRYSVLITVDVANAFNTATWSKIICRLKTLRISTYLSNIIESYLTDRILVVGRKKIKMTQGVPQGSVLGPTLWNVLYDSVLALDLPEGCGTIAYADDLALTVVANDKNALISRANAALKRINEWMCINELKLAPTKTEAVVIKGARNGRDIAFKLGNNVILPTNSVKYLGVWVDGNLKYKEHIRKTVTKAEKLVTALTRIIPNISGLGSEKRLVYYGVVQSIMLYAAPVWYKVMKINKYQEMFVRLQRRMLLRVACAYRTISTNALGVISGVAPIDLLVKERVNIFNRRLDETLEGVRIDEKATTLAEWQTRWQNNERDAQWTKRLIPNLKPWLNCSFRKTDYFLTQFLSGHGCYRAYAYRMGKTDSDKCYYCGETDTAEHTVLVCEKWDFLRAGVVLQVGVSLSVENIIVIMLENAKNWGLIHKLVKNIMERKEKKELELQKGGR